MARQPIREPQDDPQRIDQLELLVKRSQAEISDLQHENIILRDLMVKYLTAEQIIDILTQMEFLRRPTRPS